MSTFFSAPSGAARNDFIQGRLLTLAALFLVFFSVLLTLSPAVRLRTWEVDYRWNHWAGYGAWLLTFILLHRFTSRRLPDRDPYLLPAAALLTGWGLLTVWRLDADLGFRQTLWVLVALAVVSVGLYINSPLNILRRYKYVWLTGGLLLTALTFFFGTYPGGVGPNLWLGWGGVYIHPSEPLKLLLIIYLSAYLADRIPVSLSFMQLLLPTIVLAGASLAILLAQRDLGTATLFLVIYFLVVYMASGKRRILIVALITILLAALAGYQLFDVIQRRVDAWVNPWPDALGRAYQIIQSLIAIAAGGLTGSGVGLGSPGIIPVSHSDFIFSSIAEETGLAGTLVLIGLIVLITARGFRTAICSANIFQRYLAAGLTIYLAVQSIMIIGGNIRLLPLTGVTLPFVSYGGSSLITSWAALLTILIISNRSEDEPAATIEATPYFFIASILFIAFAAIALLNGWWAVARSQELVNRPDNPRWMITDQFVRRGRLLDRDNEEIVTSIGLPGAIRRYVAHSPLGPVVGYTHIRYGQSGLEATLNPILRGVVASADRAILSNQIFHGQRPPGLDVRLSIDLDLQRTADSLLQGNQGALILLNAQSGEILAMASHPYFDPNEIETQWSQWVQDENAPLLNRATQGQYPPGAALGPFFLAYMQAHGQLPIPPDNLSVSFQHGLWKCTVSPPPSPGWGNIISSGCPGGIAQLASAMTPAEITAFYETLGFGETPSIRLPVARTAPITTTQNPKLASLGQDGVLVSPLQMALGAAALSANGNRPAPLIATSYYNPTSGWVILAGGQSTPVFTPAVITEVTGLLSTGNSPYWQSLGTAFTPDGPITWLLAGTRPATWKGTPLALVVVLEEDNPHEILAIGEQILRATIHP